MPRAHILSQGDEVVTGQTVDTNAAWLAEHLTALGVDVIGHAAARDDLGEIERLVARAAAEADVVLCTGGLGPTEDDLTAEAVARAAGVALAFDPEAMAQIESMYARFARTMPEVNRKQAWLPAGALRLDNDWGTAPGFAVGVGGALVICLPGVPREMRAMWAHRVAPLLTERLALAPRRLVTLRTVGVGESNLQERIGPWRELDAALSYRTILPENHVKLRFAPGVAEERVRALAEELAARVGAPVFAIEGLGAEELSNRPGHGLAEVIGRRLAAAGHTLALAESCTGGLVASWCAAIPGASAWLLEGVVTYANAAKVRLGVPAALIEAHGAVSEPVARAMAEAVRARAGSTWALAITGVAGPSGGTPDKPVGTVHVALAGADGAAHRLLHLGGDRTRIQTLAAASALDLLRRSLT
jgi:nicotinamide-nucleotide amidase